MADDDKTEKATPKKRRDARKKGDVLLSKDVVTVASLIAVFGTLWLVAEGMINKVGDFVIFCFGLMSSSVGDVIVEEGITIRNEVIRTYIQVVSAPMLVAVLSAFIATGCQTGWLVAKEKLKPSLNKLNPISGFKNLFSFKSVLDALKNLLKISVLLYIIYRFYVKTIFTFGNYFYMHPIVAGADILNHIIVLVMQIAMAFIVIAVIDFGLEWYQYEKKMKMSKQDIKDEYKQTEGDPKIKGKIRQKQMQMAQQRMMNSVQDSDVIVRNPTHYAVALRYKKGMDVVPVILAMGEDELAFRIITVGERFDIPVVENVQVARALYAQGQVGKQIPPDLYNAVAKIITVVMKINKDNLEQYVTHEK
ncbi:MAG: flagellar biosynthesis protein FlhB [Eubacteriales bacterium]